MNDASGPLMIVLGAAGGIGSELSRMLAARGMRLLLAGRRAEPLETLAAEIQSASPAGSRRADVVVLDATNVDELDRALQEACGPLGQPAGLACCVGSILIKPAHATSSAEWAQTIAVNLTSAFAAVRSAGKLMRGAGGSVVLVSSAAGRLGLASHEAIAAAKAGVIGLTLSAAATYASAGIRVNAVAPGLTQTPLSAALISSDLARKASTGMHALGRLGEPRDIASAIAFLLDPAQSWITGSVLGVDGGLSSVQPRIKI